jgi:hypothetical protein
MLAFLRGKGWLTERKSRLYGVAACRRIWHLLTDERSRQAVAIAEKYADNLADAQQLSAAFEAAFHVGANMARRANRAEDADRCAAWAASTAAHPDEQAEDVALMVDLAAHATGMEQEREAQTELLHCLVGNPFHQIVVQPVWLAWNAGTVPNLAQAIYEGSMFERLPILADALEDAGCDNADILGHCRGDGPHVRGCWVLDLLLGKQ